MDARLDQPARTTPSPRAADGERGSTPARSTRRTEEPGAEALAVAGESAQARAGASPARPRSSRVATALSRIAGLVREIVAASYFGVSGAMSAFTIAFQVPNLVRSLFADAALQAAFVPVFTEQLEQGNKREAFRLASTLIFLVTARPRRDHGAVHPRRAGADAAVRARLRRSTAGPDRRASRSSCSRSWSCSGSPGWSSAILNSYDRFGAFAISPLFWNLAIIAVLVALAPVFHGDDQIYAYAIGVLVGTVIQLRSPPGTCATRRSGCMRVLRLARAARAPRAAADAAGDDQPRADQLQPADQQPLRHARLRRGARPRSTRRSGSTCCRRGSSRSRSRRCSSRPWPGSPARRDYDDLRATMANGMRQILLLLIPAAAAILVLSEPMIRLVYQRGEFDAARDRRWSRRRSSGSPSRCRSTASSCC